MPVVAIIVCERENMSEQVPDTGTTKSFATQVSEVVNRIDVSNSLTAPLRRAIDDLLQLAATSVGAAVASVLVRDGDEGGLKFLTATSGVSDELLALRLPPRANGEMVGVLEFVNRPGDPPYPPFTPAEMDRGSRFADAIARLVDAFEIAQLVESLFDYSVKASMSSAGPANLEDGLREWIEQSQAAAEHRDLMLSWVSLREIIARGGAEREFCRDLLQMISRFMKRRSGGGGNFGF